MHYGMLCQLSMKLAIPKGVIPLMYYLGARVLSSGAGVRMRWSWVSSVCLWCRVLCHANFPSFCVLKISTTNAARFVAYNTPQNHGI